MDLMQAYNAAIKRVPSSDLGAGLENVGEFERHDSKDRIVLAVSLITDRNCDDRRSPVAYKPFGSRVEDGAAAHGLCPGAVDLVRLNVSVKSITTAKGMLTSSSLNRIVQ